jgi:hypothetical protein
VVSDARYERNNNGGNKRTAEGKDLMQDQTKSSGLTAGGHIPGLTKIQDTLGWQPTCTHDAQPIASTVLDPFAGSGTTLMVARSLGRNAVGLDLSYPYLHDQARSRLSLDALDAWQNGAAQDGTDMSGLPMFEVQP